MDFIPGFLQGVTRVLVSYPFDYLKTHLQMNKVESATKFLKANTVKSMYRGIAIPLTTIPIDRAIQYRMYEYMNGNMNPFYSGMLCGCISSIYNLPFSYLSNNYVLDTHSKNLSKYIRSLNFGEIYSGYKPELLRSAISTTIYLGVYGNMRKQFGNSDFQCMVNSVTAGISLWTVVYPLDTLKIEQQRNNDYLTNILKRRIEKMGVLNMWKGIGPVYFRTIPSSVTGMLVYEKSKSYINAISDNK